MPALSVEDAVAQIAAQTKLSPQDVRDFIACSDEQRQILIQTYKDSNAMPQASDWDKVIAVLKMVAEIASIVLPIVGAVNAVYGLGKTIAS